ncbi:flagellar hook-associated protein FlgK [Pluralibacter gergoviae]
MSSLMNNAMSGLNAAQAALNTVSNNIANYNIAGYTRQTTVMAASNSTLTGSGWVGNGVTVTGVQREYNAFISSQLSAAQNQSSGLASRFQQMSKINDLLASTTNSISTSMQDFFSSLQTLVSNPEDPAARQSVLGKAQGLVNQFATSDRYLRDQDKQINGAVASSVAQINGYTQQIADLNDKISRLGAAGGGTAPNDLLDQRDRLVSQLNQVTGVDVTVQDGNIYNVSLANGYSLVQGGSARALAAVPDSADPSRTTVAWVNDAGKAVAIPDGQIASGSLGGMLTFRTQDLDSARNSLNQMAQALAQGFNQQNAQGVDGSGQSGGAFFTIGGPAAQANTDNRGSASLSAAVTDGSKLQASNYRMTFDGKGWQVARLPDNAPVQASVGKDGSLNFDGLSVSVGGQAGSGDSFVIKPVSDAILGMQVALKDGSAIAMGSKNGETGAGDNRNGQALLDLQNSKLVGGNKTLNDAYASLVSRVGNTTATLKTSSESQASVVTQLTKQQQSISGINLDEEYGNLQLFQQYYLANAQVMRTASTLFDTLLNLR